jgi:hypothetical protein
MDPQHDGADVSLEHAASWAAYDNVETFLRDDNWYPDAIEGLTAFASRYIGDHGEYRVIVHVNVELAQVYVYVVAPENVPEERRSAVAEFITRANYGLRIGNYELDFRDGEVRYKSSLDFEGADLSSALLRNLMYPAVQTVDRYQPGLQSVGFDGATPAAAVAEIEGRPRP